MISVPPFYFPKSNFFPQKQALAVSCEYLRPDGSEVAFKILDYNFKIIFIYIFEQ